MSAPRVLVVRFTAIGDCVMAAWAATAIRERHPDAFLCWAVESRCAPVIDRSRLVSRLEEIPRDRWKRARWSPPVWREQLLKYARLRSLRFDLGIDLQGHSKTAICLRLAQPKQRIATKATDPLAARLNPIPGPRPAGLHTVEWDGRVLETVGDYKLPVRPLMPRDDEAAKAMVEKIGGDQPLATIAVSAGNPGKAYPAASWIEVAQGLVSRGYRVAMLGGPTDKSFDFPDAIDLVGKMNLASTLETVRLSAVHLAGDTGTGHMAAALGVPVVSIFGPTDPVQYRPYAEQGRVLRNGEETSLVAPHEVLGAVNDLVGR